jgi:nucleoside-diphosphate-sugar epimerase
VVAVIGATGCIGRHVCSAFSRAGHDLLAIARNHVPHIGDYKFTPLDFAGADSAEIAEIFESERVDVVVNAAGGWVRTEEEMIHSHVRLVERLLEATAAMSRQPYIIQIGSIHEYGPAPYGTSIDETVTPGPATPYAQTKLLGARAVLDATRGGRADGVVLRVVNVCGPHTTPASFLGAVLEKLRDMNPGDAVELDIAEARRDYVDARDVADAVVRAADARVAGRVINIGRGTAVDMRELVALLVAAAGLPPDAVRVRKGRVESYSRGNGWTQADVRLAGELLGWSPRISLRDSLREMWEAAGS